MREKFFPGDRFFNIINPAGRRNQICRYARYTDAFNLYSAEEGRVMKEKKGKKTLNMPNLKRQEKNYFPSIILFKSACFQFYRKIYWKVFTRLPIENSIGKCDVYGGSSFREARKERKDGLFSAQSVRGIQRATQRALFSPADNTSGIPREFKQIARSRDYYWKSAAEDVVQTTSRFAGTVTPTRRDSRITKIRVAFRSLNSKNLSSDLFQLFAHDYETTRSRARFESNSMERADDLRIEIHGESP